MAWGTAVAVGACESAPRNAALHRRLRGHGVGPYEDSTGLAAWNALALQYRAHDGVFVHEHSRVVRTACKYLYTKAEYRVAHRPGSDIVPARR
jgi:hypothetical protein